MFGFLSIEGLFILHTFQFVLSGILEAFFFYRNFTKDRRLTVSTIILPILISSSLGLAIIDLGFLRVSNWMTYQDFRILFQDMQAIGITFLWIFLTRQLGRRSILLIMFIALFSSFLDVIGFRSLLVTPVIISLGVMIYYIYLNKHKQSGTLSSLIALFLLFFNVSAIFHNLKNRDSNPILEAIAILVVLIVLAFWIERQDSSWLTSFYIRLNLVFILLAAILMAFVSSYSRDTLMEMNLDNARNPAERVRGYLLYYMSKGMLIEGILDQAPLTEALLSVFSRLSNIRNIRLILEDNELAYTLKSNGTVNREKRISRKWDIKRHDLRLQGKLYVKKSHILMIWPLLYNNRTIGFLEFDQSPIVLNRTIRHQLLWIFGLFTGAVVFAGGLIGIVLLEIQHVITEQYAEIQATRNELIHAGQLALLGEMAANLAHEINNPAGIITTRAGLMKLMIEEQNRSKSFQEQNLDAWLHDMDVIQEQALKIGRFTHDLIDLARPRPLHLEVVDLIRIVNKSWKLVYNPYQPPEIHFNIDSMDSLQIEGDAVRLEQVLMNIFKNSIQSMPGGGVIDVQVRRKGKTVLLKIRDNGPGISKDEIKHIWTPFYTTRSRGSGLGLSIVKRIIEIHHGSIRVTSDEGYGTLFTICLPCKFKDSEHETTECTHR